MSRSYHHQGLPAPFAAALTIVTWQPRLPMGVFLAVWLCWVDTEHSHSVPPLLQCYMLLEGVVHYVQSLAQHYREAGFLKTYGNVSDAAKYLFKERLKARVTPTFYFFRNGEIALLHYLMIRLVTCLSALLC